MEISCFTACGPRGVAGLFGKMVPPFGEELLICRQPLHGGRSRIMRLDKYLKVSRLIKRRTVANEACDAGRVLINGRPAKASANVKEGDIITIAFGNKDVKVEVVSVQETARKEEAKELFRYL